VTTATVDEFDTYKFVKNMTSKGMPEPQAEALAEYLLQRRRCMAAQESAPDGEYPGAARARADAQWRIIKTAGGIALGLLYLAWLMMWLVTSG